MIISGFKLQLGFRIEVQQAATLGNQETTLSQFLACLPMFLGVFAGTSSPVIDAR